MGKHYAQSSPMLFRNLFYSQLPLEMRERKLRTGWTWPSWDWSPCLPTSTGHMCTFILCIQCFLRLGPRLHEISDERDNNHHKRWVEALESHMKKLNQMARAWPQGCWVKRVEEETFKPRHSCPKVGTGGGEEHSRKNSTKTQYLGFCEPGKLG